MTRKVEDESAPASSGGSDGLPPENGDNEVSQVIATLQGEIGELRGRVNSLPSIWAIIGVVGGIVVGVTTLAGMGWQTATDARLEAVYAKFDNAKTERENIVASAQSERANIAASAETARDTMLAVMKTEFAHQKQATVEIKALIGERFSELDTLMAGLENDSRSAVEAASRFGADVEKLDGIMGVQRQLVDNHSAELKRISGLAGDIQQMKGDISDSKVAIVRFGSDLDIRQRLLADQTKLLEEYKVHFTSVNGNWGNISRAVDWFTELESKYTVVSHGNVLVIMPKEQFNLEEYDGEAVTFADFLQQVRVSDRITATTPGVKPQ